MQELTLEQRVERAEAINAARNLLGRYEFWHASNLHEQCLSLFALETPGVSIEMDWGVYEGAEGVRRFFCGYHSGHEATKVPPEKRLGDLHLHTQTTQIIEVADDLKTTSGVSISPGIETGEPDGSLSANWIWNKYSFDCVKEGDAWKIWHLRTYNMFMCPYHESWVEHKAEVRSFMLPPSSAPDRYLDGSPAWRYGVDKPAVNVPAPPMPHRSYEESRAKIVQAEMESMGK